MGQFLDLCIFLFLHLSNFLASPPPPYLHDDPCFFLSPCPGTLPSICICSKFWFPSFVFSTQSLNLFDAAVLYYNENKKEKKNKIKGKERWNGLERRKTRSRTKWKLSKTKGPSFFFLVSVGPRFKKKKKCRVLTLNLNFAAYTTEETKKRWNGSWSMTNTEVSSSTSWFPTEYAPGIFILRSSWTVFSLVSSLSIKTNGIFLTLSPRQVVVPKKVRKPLNSWTKFTATGNLFRHHPVPEVWK